MGNDMEPKYNNYMERKYYKARIIKTGKFVYVEWSDMAGEYYEKGTGEAYQADEIELL